MGAGWGLTIAVTPLSSLAHCCIVGGPTQRGGEQHRWPPGGAGHRRAVGESTDRCTMDGRRRRGGRERLRLNLGLAVDTTDDPTSPYFADGEVLTRARIAVCAVPDRQAALHAGRAERNPVPAIIFPCGFGRFSAG